MDIGALTADMKLQDWYKTDQWALSDDGRTASVSGRTKKPLSQKLNPLWWLKNDFEPDPPAWYMPGKPQWRRVVMWYLRNPLQNFNAYVIGVKDRDYTIVGSPHVMVALLEDIGERGWAWKVTKLGWLRLPHISYSGSKILVRAGWAPWGDFRLKLTVH
jgi:hypothetical protein